MDSDPKIVKRYANRKLYDTQRSCYVTLEDIAEMIRAGEEVMVVDNKTGEDLTSVTLAQIIFEVEKKENFMPLGLLRKLIQDGGDTLGGFARDGVDRVQAKAQEFVDLTEKVRHDLESRIDRVISRKSGDSVSEGDMETHKELRSLQDLLDSSQHTFSEIQHYVEDQLKTSVDKVSMRANMGAEVEELRKRLASIEERLTKFLR